MDVRSLLTERRPRNLAILAGLALLAVAAAFLALLGPHSEPAAEAGGRLFFPHLREEANQNAIAKIHIVSKKDGAFDIVFLPDRGWVLPSRANFPVSYEQVQRTVTGLSELRKIEPKTSKPELLHFVDLDEPAKGGGGIKIVLGDEKGHVLAALILGKTEDIGDPTGAVGVYVREPKSSQSWLVKSLLDLQSDPAAWMQKDVLGLDRARIRQVSVAPPSGPAYTVRREKPGDATFTLVDMPKGRELSFESAADAVAGALTGFTFTDVRPEGPTEFDNAARLSAETFDGLTVTADVAKQGNETWVRLSAEAAANARPAIAKEARTITVKASGWAYRLPDYKAQQFTATRDSLLKPPDAPKAPAAP